MLLKPTDIFNMRNVYEKKLSKKVLAVVLSCAMVFSSITICEITAKADLTTEEMVADATYNLALNKTVTANPSKQEGSEAKLTDGTLGKGPGEQAATTFTTAGTYYLLDLGQTYDASGIDQIVISYKEYNEGDIPVNGYKIQYSADSVNFVDVKTVSATDFKSQITKEPENLVEIQDVSDVTGKVRYVKLFYPDSYTWGIQATEIAVLDTDLNAQVVEVEKCDDASAVTVTPSLYNTIIYNITAGANQEDYVYMVYLDGTKKIGHAVSVGTDYTVTGVDGGSHTLSVIAVYDGKLSEGITSESFSVTDISTLVSDVKNVANKRNNPLASIYSVSNLYEGHTLTSA